MAEKSQNTVITRPFFRLMLAQIGAGMLVVATEMAVSMGLGLGLEVWILVSCQAFFASILSLFFALGWGWVVVQLALPWVTWGALYLEIPSWVYFACFALTYAFYRNATSERVPLYLSNRTTWLALGELIERSPNPERGTFIDLGSGVGGTLDYLGKLKPGWQFNGVESAPLSFVISWIRAKFSKNHNVFVNFADIWTVDLGGVDMVYAFLSPAPMDRLLKKVKSEMRHGGVFISNSFWPDGEDFDECLELSDSRKTKLYIKKM